MSVNGHLLDMSDFTAILHQGVRAMNDSCRIIIAEDHDSIRQILELLSIQVDHCRLVAEAKTGQEALDAINSVAADLLMLDLKLPVLSGIDVIREAKRNNHIKILVVTMQTDKGIIDKALKAGADGIVLKDSGIQTIKKAVLETLQGDNPIYIDPPV